MSEQITVDEDELETMIDERVEAQVKEQQKKISRRKVLTAAAGAAGVGAMGFGVGTASADPSDASGTVYFEQIGSSQHPVQDFYVQDQFITENQDNDLGGNDLTGVGSLSTEEATIGGVQSDYNWERLRTFQGPIATDAANPETFDTTAYDRIRVVAGQRADGGSDSLFMRINEVSSTDYFYQENDIVSSELVRSSDETEIRVMNPSSTGGTVEMTIERAGGSNRIVVHSTGASASGRVLMNAGTRIANSVDSLQFWSPEGTRHRIAVYGRDH